jgi:hypothetical protein
MKVQVLMDISIDGYSSKEEELQAIREVLTDDWGLGSVSVEVLELTEVTES